MSNILCGVLMLFKRPRWLGVGAVVIMAGALGGCTKMIQPDQLAELKQLRAREVQLAQSIRDGESRKQRLERELSSRQDELKRCNDLRATIQSRLNGFPGNLGEPLPETPPAPPVQKKGRK
ncbi:MAG: hypothetical protein D6747_02630 [Chlorobiota bacterium]|nr:MAG: hypothetical protein D6747_02630 [Chlorobiota bacterium]